jgi:DNA mismatch endonuclease Vsr
MPPPRRSGPVASRRAESVLAPSTEPNHSGGAARVMRPAVWHDVPAAIRKTMQSNRGKDTAPERELRSLAHSLGYRFRKHVRGLPGTPDLVFLGRRKAVWLHGCFWHSHLGCRFATVPRTRTEYWVPKLEQNRARDAQQITRLHNMGWETLVIWECELDEPAKVQESLRRFLGPPRSV